MRLDSWLTPAERRLCLLLLLLALAGVWERSRSRLPREVVAWLETLPEGTPPPRDPVPPSPSLPQGPQGVDPNTATPDQLRGLSGIGPALAARIVEDRLRNGPYLTPEDLLRVRGIGPATLARFREELLLGTSPPDSTVSPSPPLPEVGDPAQSPAEPL